MPDPSISNAVDNTVIGALGTIIVALLGKLGWDHKKKSNIISIADDEITPDSKPTRRDTILMLLTDRVHAVRNELTPQIGKLQLEDAKMDLRITQNRDDLLRLRVDMESGFKDVNLHIDNRSDKLENQIDTSVERIWKKLDGKA